MIPETTIKEVEVLSIKSGDIVILKLDFEYPEKLKDQLYSWMKKHLPQDTQLLVIPKGIDLSVVRSGPSHYRINRE